MDLDDILKQLGQLEKYQIIILFLLFFPNVFTGMGSMTYVFTTGEIDYRCRIPECEGEAATSYEQDWLDSAIPEFDDENRDRCLRYKTNNNSTSRLCSDDSFSETETMFCDDFVFKNNDNTITKEFNLLCDKNKWKRTLVGTMSTVAQFIGTPIMGALSDRYGRKWLIIGSALLSSILGTIRSFTRNYEQFLTFEILDGIAYSGLYATVYIYGMEIIGPDKRGFGGTMICNFGSVGAMVLGAIVWMFPYWRVYLRITYIPALLFTLYIWVFPESLRWLISNGKKEEIIRSLKRISKVNKKPLTEDILMYIKELETGTIKSEKDDRTFETKRGNPICDVIGSGTMLLRVLNCSFCWIVHTLLHYGLSVESVLISHDKYLNFILSSAVEIPARIVTWLLIDLLGRKALLSFGLMLSGLSCTAFYFIPDSAPTMKLLLFLVIKFAVTISFTSLYALASEFYPTNLRNTLVGFSSTMGRFGSMVAPQVSLLEDIINPFLVFGAAAFLGGILGLYFPETTGCNLPETIEEAELLGKKNRKAIKKNKVRTQPSDEYC